MVYKADRLSRNVRDALEIFDRIEERLISCDSPNTDRFVLTVLFAIAERERLNTKLRTKLALEEQKRKFIEREGEMVFANVPMTRSLVFGYFSKEDWATAVYNSQKIKWETLETLLSWKMYDLNAYYKKLLREKRAIPIIYKKDERAIQRLSRQRENKAEEFVRSVYPLVIEYKNLGYSLEKMAELLTTVRKIKTSGGKDRWTKMQVKRVLEKGEELQIPHSMSRMGLTM
jgi:hypothetical protein